MNTAATATQSTGQKTKTPKSSSWKNLSGLVPYLGRYKGAIAIGLLTLALMGIVGNVIPLATGIATDTLAGSPRPFEQSLHGATDVGPLNWLSRVVPHYQPNSRNTLGFYCLVVVLCIAIKGVMSFLTRWVLIGVSRDIEFDIRSDLLNRLLIMEPEFYVRNRTGELMSRATNDLNAGPHGSWSRNHVQRHDHCHHGPLDLRDVGHLPLSDSLGSSARACRGRGRMVFRAGNPPTLRKNSGRACYSFRQSSGKSFRRSCGSRLRAGRSAEIRGFDEPNREYVAENVQLIRTWSIFMPSLQAMIGTTFLIVLWQGGRLYLHGQMSLGALITFNTYLGFLVWPMIALGWVTNIFQRGAASMGRLNYILTAQAAD